MTIERDYEIAEAATSLEPLSVYDEDGVGPHLHTADDEQSWYYGPLTLLHYIAHFHPTRVRKLLDVVKAAKKVRWNEPHGNLTDAVARTELRKVLEAYEDDGDG